MIGRIILLMLVAFSGEAAREAAADGAPPGRTLVLGGTEFRGNHSLASAYLLDQLASRPGDPLDSAAMERDLAAVSLAYARNGHPHAAITPAEFRMESDSVRRVISIDEGPRVTVAGLRFSGNRTTKHRVMARLTGLAAPAAFDSRRVELAVKRLVKSGLFASALPPHLEASPGAGPGEEVLVFTVMERPYHGLYGAVGYSQPEGSERGWLAGALSLSLSNIAGTARAFKLDWERPRRENSRLELGYTEPWVLGYPLSAELGAGHRVEDSSYVQTRASALLVVSLGENFSAGFGGGLERVVPGTSQSVGRSLKYSSLWQLRADLRNDDRMGTGLWASTRLEYGRKRYSRPEAQHTLARVWGDAGFLARVWRRLFAYTGLHGRAVSSGEHPVPRPDQFPLGGAGSLRGYFEEQFVADQVAWGTAELRLAADRALSFHPFWDAGYYWDGGRGQRGIRHGYGLGFRLETRIGRVAVDYGLGRDDGLMDGKIHLLLGSEF